MDDNSEPLTMWSSIQVSHFALTRSWVQISAHRVVILTQVLLCSSSVPSGKFQDGTQIRPWPQNVKYVPQCLLAFLQEF